jgi:perosamine synthetase
MFRRIPRFSPSFSPLELATVLRSLTHRGDEAPVLQRFENEFARIVGTRHAVMVPSARWGFYLLLQGLGIKPGDEILLPALTFFAIPAMALAAGVTPVPVDIGLRTHVIDPDALEAAITPRTRAVVPTHLFGTPCDMDRIVKIARKHGIKVIEDTAQAMGARYRGQMVGSLGDAAYYTFGLTKNMTTLSGAMVTTSDDALAEALRGEAEGSRPAPLSKPLKEAMVGTAMYVATHPLVYPFTVHQAIVLGNRLGKDPIHEPFGEKEVRWAEVPGWYRDIRPRAIQAEVGLVQLAKLDRLNGARAANGRFLDENLADVPDLVTPQYPNGAEPIYMSFVVHHKDRDALARGLRKRGVDTTIGYMSNFANHPLFSETRKDCPNAQKAFEELLHLPVHPNLGRKDLEHMVAAVRAAILELRS